MKIDNAVKSELRNVKAKSTREGVFKNQNTVRDFKFLIDEPYKLGGSNEAPTPMEYVLGSFNGCILIVIELIANEIEFSFRDLTSESVGTVDRRGMFGTADVSPHFQTVNNTIVFDTDESEERIQELKQLVQKRCPVYNLLKDAGIAIDLHWIPLREVK